MSKNLLILIVTICFPVFAQEHILTKKQREILEKMQHQNRNMLIKLLVDPDNGYKEIKNRHRKREKEYLYYQKLVEKEEHLNTERDKELIRFHKRNIETLSQALNDLKIRSSNEISAEFKRLSKSLQYYSIKLMQSLNEPERKTLTPNKSSKKDIREKRTTKNKDKSTLKISNKKQKHVYITKNNTRTPKNIQKKSYSYTNPPNKSVQQEYKYNYTPKKSRNVTRYRYTKEIKCTPKSSKYVFIQSKTKNIYISKLNIVVKSPFNTRKGLVYSKAIPPSRTGLLYHGYWCGPGNDYERGFIPSYLVYDALDTLCRDHDYSYQANRINSKDTYLCQEGEIWSDLGRKNVQKIFGDIVITHEKDKNMDGINDKCRLKEKGFNMFSFEGHKKAVNVDYILAKEALALYQGSKGDTGYAFWVNIIFGTRAKIGRLFKSLSRDTSDK